MKRINLYVSEKTYEWLRTQAYKTRKSQSQLVREGLELLKKKEKK